MLVLMLGIVVFLGVHSLTPFREMPAKHGDNKRTVIMREGSTP